jgi:methionyl-tRNA formyltransferase
MSAHHGTVLEGICLSVIAVVVAVVATPLRRKGRGGRLIPTMVQMRAK